MAKADRDKLLEDAGITQLHPSTGCGLALKADLNITWHALRKLRKWLRAFGVDLESEKDMRKQLSEEIPFDIVCENIPLLSKAHEMQLRPMVAITDLHQVIMYYLEMNEVVGNLTWHDGAIPADLIVIKVAGDHGGGSFKLCFQIANCPNPNSLKNTIPICIFEAPDSAANLLTATERYSEQLKTLNGSSWKTYKIKIVLFGDYDSQMTNYLK